MNVMEITTAMKKAALGLVLTYIFAAPFGVGAAGAPTSMTAGAESEQAPHSSGQTLAQGVTNDSIGRVYVDAQDEKLSFERKLLEERLVALAGKIEVQDKRIDQQNDFFGHILTVVGIVLSFLAIVMAAAGVAGYLTVRRKAVDEARDVAVRETSSWFEQRAEKLTHAIAELYGKLDTLESDADARYERHQVKMREMEASAELARRTLQERLGNNLEAEPMSMAASLALAESATAAQSKAAADRTFNDWNNSAFEAYRNKDMVSALESWIAASRVEGASPEEQARALYNAALAYTDLKRFEDAISAYEEFEKRFASSGSESVKLHVAKAMLNLGVLLSRSGRNQEAIQVYSRLIGRLEGVRGIEFEEQCANALLNLGIVYRRTHERDAEFGAYDQILARFDGRADPELRKVLAMGLVNYAVAMGEIGDSIAERERYASIVEKYGGDSAPPVREQVGKAMLGMAASFARAGEYDQEIEWQDRLVASFVADNSDKARLLVATALMRKAIALAKLEQPDNAFNTYDDIRGRFESDKNSEVRRQVSIAIFNQGVHLSNIERASDALNCYDEVIVRLAGEDGSELVDLNVQAMTNKAAVLGLLGRYEEQLTVCREVISTFDHDGPDKVDEWVATAMLYAAEAQGNLDRNADSVLGYKAVVEKFAKDDGKSIRLIVAKALLEGAAQQIGIGEFEAGISSFDQLLSDVKRYGEFSIVLAAARIGRGFAFVSRAKMEWGDSMLRLDLLNSALAEFECVLRENSEHFLGLQNKAYCLYLMEASLDDVVPVLAAALQSGGEEAYEAAISDTEMMPIPEVDSEFRSVIEEQWRLIRG